jgi:hypothetical protein
MILDSKFSLANVNFQIGQHPPAGPVPVSKTAPAEDSASAQPEIRTTGPTAAATKKSAINGV